MYRFSYRIAEALVIISLVLSPPAFPQSADNTGQAKQHYQNAVTAIGKSDWQIAKSELLQAEKLAPQNALVHYDLALAYSHTGQVKSAQVELNKALQLGLPAEQKQAAQQLKQRLASQAAESKNSSAGDPVSHEGQFDVRGDGVTTASGLTYWDVQAGTGESAKNGTYVTVNYAMWADGKQIDAHSKANFRLGVQELIAGFEEGMLGMKLGGKRRLRIPPNLAYGEKGAAKAGISPNATVVMDVELVGVQDDPTWTSNSATSLQATLDYVNSRFVSADAFHGGKVTLSEDHETVKRWYDSYNQYARSVIRHEDSALVVDLDARSTSYEMFNDVYWVNMSTKSGATHEGKGPLAFGPYSLDTEQAKRLVKAYAHLIDLLQAEYRAKHSGDNDPFAK
jgi:FKBP-type peptidyl-prolyl cis-trans isomerase